jgi:hypothetical protein
MTTSPDHLTAPNRSNWLPSYVASLRFPMSPSRACIEMTELSDGRVAVRHSKDVSGPVLRFTSA